VTYVVSHRPHFEQWDFAGNLCGHELGSMGCGPLEVADDPFVEKRAVGDWIPPLPRKVDSPEHCDASSNHTMHSRRTPLP